MTFFPAGSVGRSGDILLLHCKFIIQLLGISLVFCRATFFRRSLRRVLHPGSCRTLQVRTGSSMISSYFIRQYRHQYHCDANTTLGTHKPLTAERVVIQATWSNKHIIMIFAPGCGCWSPIDGMHTHLNCFIDRVEWPSWLLVEYPCWVSKELHLISHQLGSVHVKLLKLISR